MLAPEGKIEMTLLARPTGKVWLESSRPVFSTERPGKWGFVAATCNLETRNYALYFNGKLVGAINSDFDSAMTFREHYCLANWTKPNWPFTDKVAPFEGYIEELMVFGKSLSQDEISRLYQAAACNVGATPSDPAIDNDGKEVSHHGHPMLNREITGAKDKTIPVDDPIGSED